MNDQEQHYPDFDGILSTILTRRRWTARQLAGDIGEKEWDISKARNEIAREKVKGRIARKILACSKVRSHLLPNEIEFFEHYAQWCEDREDGFVTESWEAYWYSLQEKFEPAEPELTLEEHEVMRLVVTGCTVYEVAGRMGMSPQSIERMLSSLFSKIGVGNLPKAIQWYKDRYAHLDTEPKLEVADERHHSLWWRLTNAIVSPSSPAAASLSIIYGVFALIFLVVWIQSDRENSLNYFSNFYLLIPLTAAFIGFARLLSHYWSIKNFPVPLVLACLALFAWSIGNMNWVYNNYKYGEDVPYPSLGDRLYLTHNVLWMIGVYWLQKALGATHVRKTFMLFMLLLFGIILGVGLIVLMWMLRNGQPHQDDPEKFFFDVSFPLTSGLTFAFAGLWRVDPSFSQLDSSMKRSVRPIVWGTVILFIADLSFSICTTLPEGHLWTYYNGGWTDFFFATAFYFLGLGILLMPLRPLQQVMTVSQLREWIVKLASSANKYLSDLMPPTERDATQQKEELVSDDAPVPKLDMPVEHDRVPQWQHWTKDIFSPYIVSLTVVYFTVFLFIFLNIWLQSCKTCFLNDYESLYLVIPLFGALLGFVRLRGHYSSIKSIPVPLMCFCLALLVWSSGNLIWLYYKLVPNVEVPYPSLADVSYFPHNLLWLAGMCILLNKMKANVRRKTSELWRTGSFLLVLLGSLIGIMLFVRGWKLDLPKDPAKFFFDVGYPLLSGFTAILLALWLTDSSFKKLDGTVKRNMHLIFFGIFLLFIADLSFNLITTFPDNHPWAYYNGAWPDFIYATALYVLGVGILSMPLETMKQMITVAQLSKPIVQWVVRIRKWSEKLLSLKTFKDKTPKLNIFIKRTNPFILFPKLLAKFIMTFNLPY